MTTSESYDPRMHLREDFMQRQLEGLLAGLTAGLLTGGTLAWWLARYEPLSQRDYQALFASAAGEAELPYRIDPERLRRHTAALSAITMRRGGTPGEEQARNWVVDQFNEVGLKKVRLSPVVYPRWQRRRRSTMTVFTPAPYEPDFIVLNGSTATPPVGIEAPLIDVGRGSEADYLVRTGRGLRGSMHLIRHTAKDSEPRRDLVRRATQQGAAAVVLAHGTPSPPGKALIENGTAVAFMGRIPALAVSHETGEYLRQQMAKGPVRALLHINVGYSPAHTANVVGELPGRKAEYVVLAAHYDAWYAGAADNAAGVACLLELARVWHQSKLRPHRTIRFVSFASEEEGLVGSLFEVLSRAPLVKARCRGVVTPDVVGVPCGTLGFSAHPLVMAEIAADAAWRMGYTEATGYPVGVRSSITYADHWPYGRLLLPALAISKGPDPLYHTPYDTADRLDYEDLRWTAALAGAMALRLAQRR